jgi:hypothetical protein
MAQEAKSEESTGVESPTSTSSPFGATTGAHQKKLEKKLSAAQLEKKQKDGRFSLSLSLIFHSSHMVWLSE